MAAKQSMAVFEILPSQEDIVQRSISIASAKEAAIYLEFEEAGE
ncbi:MAG: hypothetical protein ACI9SK_000444 [Zhongshania sp.]|jgi:hypothetical protein